MANGFVKVGDVIDAIMVAQWGREGMILNGLQYAIEQNKVEAAFIEAAEQKKITIRDEQGQRYMPKKGSAVRRGLSPASHIKRLVAVDWPKLNLAMPKVTLMNVEKRLEQRP